MSWGIEQWSRDYEAFVFNLKQKFPLRTFNYEYAIAQNRWGF